MKRDLEQLRDKMIRCFKAWANTSHEQYRHRTELWDAYVYEREKFLRESAIVKGEIYVSLSELVTRDYSPYNGLKN